MTIPHSTTPWRIHRYAANIIQDANGKSIIHVHGENEQSLATVAHILKVVNATADTPMKRTLIPEDVATIMAALRMYQDRMLKGTIEPSIREIATDNDSFACLTAHDIDGLCEEISNGFLVGPAK